MADGRLLALGAVALVAAACAVASSRRGSRAKRDDYLWSAKVGVKFDSYPATAHEDFEVKFATDYSDPDAVEELAVEILEDAVQERFDRWLENYRSRDFVADVGCEIKLLEGPTRRSFRTPKNQGG